MKINWTRVLSRPDTLVSSSQDWSSVRENVCLSVL